MGERSNRTAEVRGSIPLGSTINPGEPTIVAAIVANCRELRLKRSPLSISLSLASDCPQAVIALSITAEHTVTVCGGLRVFPRTDSQAACGESFTTCSRRAVAWHPLRFAMAGARRKQEHAEHYAYRACKRRTPHDSGPFEKEAGVQTARFKHPALASSGRSPCLFGWPNNNASRSCPVPVSRNMSSR